MKGLVLVDASRFEVRDVPKPEVAADEVLVEVKACGICGSDVHGMDGSSGRRQPPIIMGHEASGVVVEVGEAVERWKPGDRVTFDSTVYCGRCHFCRRGDVNLCDNRQVLGVSCDEFKRDGAFAEYVTVPELIVVGLPDGVSFEQAAMVEPVSIAVHAVSRVPIQLSDTAVVIGAGMIGLLTIQALKARGCGFVVAVDTKEDRLNLAGQLGADKCFNPHDCHVVEEVMKRTGGRGVDVAMEAVGFSQTVETAVASCEERWRDWPDRQPFSEGRITVAGSRYPGTFSVRVLCVSRRIPGVPGPDCRWPDSGRPTCERCGLA